MNDLDPGAETVRLLLISGGLAVMASALRCRAAAVIAAVGGVVIAGFAASLRAPTGPVGYRGFVYSEVAANTTLTVCIAMVVMLVVLAVAEVLSAFGWAVFGSPRFATSAAQRRR